MDVKQRVNFLLLVLALTPGFFAHPSFGQDTEEEVVTATDPGERFTNNLKFTSIFLARRGYGITPFRQQAGFGFDMSLLKAPDIVVSNLFDQLESKYFLIPTPVFSYERTSGFTQHQIRFAILTTSPLPGISVTYWTGSYGRNFQLDRAGNWIFGSHFFASVFRGTRVINLGSEQAIQDFGLTHYAMEILLNYQFASSQSASTMIFKSSLASSKVNSSYVSTTFRTNIRYNATVAYGSVGLGYCGQSRNGCFATEVYYDKVLKVMPAFTFYIRI